MPVSTDGAQASREPDSISLCDSDDCEESPVYNACFTLRLSGPTVVQESVVVSPDVSSPERFNARITPVPHHYRLRNSNVQKVVPEAREIPNGSHRFGFNGFRSTEKLNGSKESIQSKNSVGEELNGVIKCKIFAEIPPPQNGSNGIDKKSALNGAPETSDSHEKKSDSRPEKMDIKMPRIGKLGSLKSKFEGTPSETTNGTKPNFLKKRPPNRESSATDSERSSDLPANPYSLNVRQKSQIGGINLRKFGEPLKRRNSKDVKTPETKNGLKPEKPVQNGINGVTVPDSPGTETPKSAGIDAPKSIVTSTPKSNASGTPKSPAVGTSVSCALDSSQSLVNGTLVGNAVDSSKSPRFGIPKSLSSDTPKSPTISTPKGSKGSSAEAMKNGLSMNGRTESNQNVEETSSKPVEVNGVIHKSSSLKERENSVIKLNNGTSKTSKIFKKSVSNLSAVPGIDKKDEKPLSKKSEILETNNQVEKPKTPSVLSKNENKEYYQNITEKDSLKKSGINQDSSTPTSVKLKPIKKSNLADPIPNGTSNSLTSVKLVNSVNKTFSGSEDTTSQEIKKVNELPTNEVQEDSKSSSEKPQSPDKTTSDKPKKVIKKKIIKVPKKKTVSEKPKDVEEPKLEEPSKSTPDINSSKAVEKTVLQDLTLTQPGEKILEGPQTMGELESIPPTADKDLELTPGTIDTTNESSIGGSIPTEEVCDKKTAESTIGTTSDVKDKEIDTTKHMTSINSSIPNGEVSESKTSPTVVCPPVEQLNPNNEENRRLNQLLSMMNGDKRSPNRNGVQENLISPEVSITEPPTENGNPMVSALPHPPSHLRESAELLVARVQSQKRAGSVPKIGAYYNSLKRRSKINRNLPTLEPIGPSLTGYLDDAEARLSRAIRSPLSVDRDGPELFSREMSIISTSTDTPDDDLSVSEAEKSQASAIVEQTGQLLSETDILLRKSRSGNSLRRSFSRDMTALNINKLYEMTVDLSEEQNASQLISERLQTEQNERLKLQKEVVRLQDDLRKMTNMNGDHDAISRDLEILRSNNLNGDISEEGMDSGLYKKKYEWSQKEVELLKKQVMQLRQDGEDQFLLLKKQLEKKLLDAEQEAEEQRQVVAQLKKKSQKVTSEMNDIKILLEDQTSRNNLLEKKQRRFDQEMQTVQDEARKEKLQKETAQRDRDQTLAAKYTLDQDILTLKLENELKDERIAALKAELDELHSSGNLEEETIMFKKIKNELEMKNKDQEEELDEMAGQVQMLEAAKIRLEMSIEQIRKENKLESAQRDQELEEFRMSSQKKLRNLENQLEMQYEERSQLLREKHELERKLSDAQDKAMAQHDDDHIHRLKRDLRKTKVLLRDTQTQLERAQSEGSSKLLIRQLKTQLEDAEFARTAALKGKQIAEADVREIQSFLEESTRSKKDAEDRAIKIAKEKAEIYSQMEESEEELSELMKKYKTAVHQHSQDQIILSEQTQQIAELEHEKQILQDKMLELSSKVEVLEGESASIHTQRRLQMKVKEVESKLELEHTARHRFESQISRLKDQLDRETSESEASRNRESKLLDESKKLNRLLRETREDLSCAHQKNTESFSRKQEVEKQLELAESEIITLKSDLKLAFKRIEDLQQALQGDISDSESDGLDTGSDSDLSLSSYVSASANYRRSQSTGVSTGVSNSPSIERQITSKDETTTISVLEDPSAGENQPSDSFA